MPTIADHARATGELPIGRASWLRNRIKVEYPLALLEVTAPELDAMIQHHRTSRRRTSMRIDYLTRVKSRLMCSGPTENLCRVCGSAVIEVDGIAVHLVEPDDDHTPQPTNQPR